MTLVFPDGLRFDCGSCTRCCRGTWSVPLDPQAWRRISTSDLFARLTEEDGAAPAYLEDPEAGECSARTRLKGADCAFLAPDGKCLVHKELGASAKPFGCSQFPFLVRPTPDGVYVGVSFYCSAVQANHGRPLSEHVGDLERAVASHHFPRIGSRVALDPQRDIAWEVYRDLEASAESTLAGTPGLREGLWLAALRIVLLSSLLGRQGGEAGERWQQVRGVNIPYDEIFASLEDIFLVGIVGAIESRDPAECRANCEAFVRRGHVVTESFGAIDLTHFDDFRGRFDPAWSEAEMRRFVEHLLFRKFLPYKRNLAANAAAWYLTVPLLSLYRDLSAFSAGRLQPDITDLRRGFEIVERSFTLHVNLLDPLFEELASGYRRMLDAMPELTAGGPP